MAWRNAFKLGYRDRIDDTACTIQSHGAGVVGGHKHNWLILLLLVAVNVGLNMIQPFHRFVSQEMMTDLKYPMKENTIPGWAVPVYSVLLPIIIFLLFYVRRRDVYDLHNSILGLLLAVLITRVLTHALKDGVGRPRPDFFWRCFPDGVDVYDKWGNVVCHGNESEIEEGYESFPSGHASLSFAGMGFLSLYLAGETKAFAERGNVAKLCVVILPLLWAVIVAISRVDDYWHHWQDVLAGGFLGLVVATVCYLQFFPAPFHSRGWGSYDYLGAVEEERLNSPPDGHRINTANKVDRVVNRETWGPQGDVLISMDGDHKSSSPTNDIEFGRT